MKAAFAFAVASLCVALSLAAKGAFDYHPMTIWTGECLTGKQQSPINIDSADTTPVAKDAARVDFKTMGVANNYTIYFTGFALQVGFDGFSKKTNVRIPANAYTIGKSKKVKEGDLLKVTPLQMHFHTVSEHTIDGFYAPAELHIVTKVDDGESDHCDENGPCLAVFGIMMSYSGEGDDTNKAMARLFKDLPTGVGAENGISPKKPMKLDDFLPKNKDYYTYLGSLTTPPCSEIVTWHVFKDPVAISAKMIDEHQRMAAYTPGDDCTFNYFGVCTPPREKTNHRNVQPYYGRTIYSVEE